MPCFETYKVYIYYVNKSAKKVVGVKFGLDLMDSTNDWSEYPENFSTSYTLKPGSSGDDPEWAVYPDQTSATRVYVLKVAFDDGTTWTDDGTKACQYVKKFR